ncbi:MAG: helix-turn-helix transcriptional regulator [Myxococcota bacterium]
MKRDQLRLSRIQVDGETLLVLSAPLPSPDPLPGLTVAEADVLDKVLAGHSNHEIAALRGTQVRTVANQVASLFRKAGVSGRAELVACVFGRGRVG